TLAGDRALIPSDDARLTELALSILTTAKHHDAPTLSLWPTGPGIGKILSLGLLSAIHDLRRLPRVQDCASSARLVQCREPFSAADLFRRLLRAPGAMPQGIRRHTLWDPRPKDGACAPHVA